MTYKIRYTKTFQKELELSAEQIKERQYRKTSTHSQKLYCHISNQFNEKRNSNFTYFLFKKKLFK